jgi:Putative MetA-pathway of phenol degradation
MKLLTILILLSTSTIVRSQTIETDRPDQTEASSCMEKGKLQVESGVLLEFTEGNGEQARNLLLPTKLIRLGLSDYFELRLLNQYQNLHFKGKTFQGIADLEIGTKIQLYQRENANFEMALLTHLRLPTGSLLLRNTRYATLNKLCLSHNLSETLSIGYNLGYNYEGLGKGDGSYTLALNYGISEKVGTYIETYGFAYDFETFESNFDAGFTYLIQDNLQFDFSYGTGLTDRMNYLSFGLSWKSK